MIWLIQHPSEVQAAGARTGRVMALSFPVDVSAHDIEPAILIDRVRRKTNVNHATAKVQADQLFAFAGSVAIHDIVIALDRGAEGARIGTVVGDYMHVAGEPDRLFHQRAVSWSATRLSFGARGDEMLRSLEPYVSFRPIADAQLVQVVCEELKKARHGGGSDTPQLDAALIERLETELRRLGGFEERVQRYASSELHHFVARTARSDLAKGYETLSNILRSLQLTPDPARPEHHPTRLRIVDDGHIENETYCVPERICFCDIPADDVYLHTTKYGHFGLSFRKAFAAAFGARPVFYVPCDVDDWRGVWGKQLLRRIENAHRSLKEACETQPVDGGRSDALHRAASDALSVLAFDLIAFIKPFEVGLGDADARQYYLEREWRLLGNLKFTLEDVSRVFLPGRYAVRFRDDFPAYANQVTFV